MSQQRENKGGKRLTGSGSDNGTAPKKAKPQRTGRELVLHRVYVGLTIVAAVIVAGFVLWNIFFTPPEVNTPSRPMTTTMVDEEGHEVEVEIPGLSAGRKKQFYTFLLVGRDTGGGGNTDTMMLVAYDVPSQKLSVLSLPRDTMVNIPYDIKRLNGVYNYAGGGDKGIEALDREISQLVGFQPDFQVVVEWEAFGKLVDAIGGVNFDVPFRMYYNDPSQNLKIDLQKGYQLLNGDQAMGLIRYRKQSDDSGHVTGGYANGDLGRIETQQAFMKAVIAQCLKMDKLLTNLGEYITIFQENVKTNMTMSNLAYFGKSALTGLDMDNVEFYTMPNTGKMVWSRSYHSYQSYVVPNADELVALVNEHFNPYEDDLRKSELDIMYVNKDGTIGSTTGKIEDAKANSGGQRAPSDGSAKPVEDEKDIVVTPTPTPEEKPVHSAGTGDGGAVAPPEASHSVSPSQAPVVESQAPEVSAPAATTPAPTAAPTAPPATAPAEEEPLLPPGA
ncbi:MAG: LCP family protein [Lachnospirales bacterium]